MAMKETLEVQKRNSGLSRVLIPSSHGVNASTNNAHSVMRSSKVALVSGKKLSNYDLQRDYTVLAREKKVTTILEDIKLRSKLESILHEQMEGKITPKASHPLSYPCPSGWQKEARPLHQQLRVRGIVIPINDVCGEAASRYTLAESQVRCKLAAVYRLADMFGWSQLINNHITVSCAIVLCIPSMVFCDDFFLCISNALETS